MLHLTREQVRNVDRVAIERYGVPGIVLMENAAIGATRVARAMLRHSRPRTRVPRAACPPVPTDEVASTGRKLPVAHGEAVLILCGGGNSGGDGLAIARHLHNAGHRVLIALTIDPSKYAGDALINYRIARSLELPMAPFTLEVLAEECALIVDAV